MKNQAKNIESKIPENVRDSMGALSDNRLAHKTKEPAVMNFVKRKRKRVLPNLMRRGKAKNCSLRGMEDDVDYAVLVLGG